jgi:hypothetical protein
MANPGTRDDAWEDRREARETEDREIWTKTSKLLEPWSKALADTVATADAAA